MKTLSIKRLSRPLRFAGVLRIVWSRGEIRHFDGRADRVIVKGIVCCEQTIEISEHTVDFAKIVQLNRIEASELGLVSALGVIEGRQNSPSNRGTTT